VPQTADQRLAVVATPQRGLLTVAQARAAGLTSAQIVRRVERGNLVRVGGGVLAVAGHALDWERRVLAAQLAAGPAGVLSHRTAARLLGFDGFHECAPEVTVPRAHRPTLPPGAVLHTSLRLDRLDVVTLPPFRLTSGALTIVHLAATATERELLAAIGSALRDGWTSEGFLRRRFAALRVPGRHGATLLASVLDEPFGHSDLERRFLRLVARARLPRPTTQRTFRGERTIRVDAIWEAAGVVAEVMGHRFHCTALDLQRDAQRRNELQAMGLEVLEFTARDIVREPGRVVTTLRHHLKSPPV
jgi:very-short-patch-repair endonuclease